MSVNSKFKELFSGLQSRLVLIGALSGVFIFLIIFNISFLNTKVNDRGLASSSTPSVQKSFIKRLSKLEPSEMTRFSDKPNDYDKLRFELLQGKYNVFKVDDKIQRVRLNIGEEGVALQNPADFLKEYKGLLIKDSARFQKLENRTFKRDISSSMRIESYEVIEDDKLKGRLDFEFGVDGALLEVQIHSL